MRIRLLLCLSLAACAAKETAPPGSGDPDGNTPDTDTETGTTLEVTWAFDVAAMLEGAFSDVPDEALAAYPGVLGGSVTRHTAITGLEFHLPGVASSEGLSATPVPTLHHVNGVRYWQVTGELSARIVDDLGLYHVVGPIDSQGVNHRGEVFDPFDPTSDPGDTASHPRAGLPGAFFSLRWPETGFHGGMIQFQAPADGGFSFPQAPLAWMSVDGLALLDTGYAVVTVSAGGTVYGRKEADGSLTIDTNPESGTGIYWTEDLELWPGAGVWESAENALLPNTRTVTVDAAFAESPLPVDLTVELYLPVWNEETGALDPLVVEDSSIADPTVTWPIAQFAAPEMIRDASVVFRNLMTQATGPTSLWTCYVGWSGSGSAAWQLASGKQNNGLYPVDRAMGSAPGAGNFDIWGDPTSGRRFDAFVVFGGAMPWSWFADDTDPYTALVTTEVDPIHPIGAPYVFLHGDADLVVSQVNPYLQANAVAQAWAGSAMASESMDDYLLILHLDRTNHYQREEVFTTWDEAPLEDGLWWDPALDDAPEALNTEQVGHRLVDAWAKMHEFNGPNVSGYADIVEPFPRTMPMYLALFDGLRAGEPLPTSRVDPDLFEQLDAIGPDTLFPLYENPCGLSWESAWEEHLACADGLDDDGTAWTFTLLPGELAALSEFATENPLTRSTERLQLPDVAAPLGWFYFLGGIQLRRDFTEDEFAARYGTTDGYVEALAAAADALAADGLWDTSLGQHSLDDAAAGTARKASVTPAERPTGVGPERWDRELPTKR